MNREIHRVLDHHDVVSLVTYRESGGMTGLNAARFSSPVEVIELVEASGLGTGRIRISYSDKVADRGARPRIARPSYDSCDQRRRRRAGLLQGQNAAIAQYIQGARRWVDRSSRSRSAIVGRRHEAFGRSRN